jgi:insulysin
MKLVVVAPSRVNAKVALEACFAPWNDVTTPSTIPARLYSGLPFQDQAPLFVRYQPVKNLHRLEISWIIPSCNEAIDYRRKCDHYIGHLLGHEGPGSVLSSLKARGLATELSAGVS